MNFSTLKNQFLSTSIANYSAIAVTLISLLGSPIALSQADIEALPLTAGQITKSDPHSVVRKLTEEFGPYSPRLGDSLKRIGRDLQEEGDHKTALEFLQQAWQIAKVNSGIFSTQQIPTLELIIFSEMERANWDAVDKHYAYLELLYRRVYEVENPELEFGLQKVSAWHVNALSVRDRSQRVTHLRKAYHLFKDRLQMAEQNLDPSDPKFSYLKESIQITEQQLRINSQRNNSAFYQPSIAGSSLVSSSF